MADIIDLYVRDGKEITSPMMYNNFPEVQVSSSAKVILCENH